MSTLSDRQKKIIEILLQNQNSMYGKQICSLLDISPRTLRYEITSINKIGKEIIKSSKTGYELVNLPIKKNDLFEQNLHAFDKEIDTDLLIYIIHNDNCELYKLSEALYLNETSVMKTIKRVQTLIESFDLKVNRKKERIQLVGDETNMRRLISYMIRRELQTKYFEKILQKKYFKSDAITEQIQQIIDSSLVENSLTQDEFYLKSLLVNLAILIDRVKIGKKLSHYESKLNLRSLSFSEKIINKLEKAFSIKIPPLDRLYIQCQISLLDFEDGSAENLYDFSLDDEDFIEQSIDTTADLFILSRLSMSDNIQVYIKEMIVRAGHAYFFHSEFTGNVKYMHPIMYAAALHLATQVGRRFGVTFSQDEVGLLAIHLGMFYDEPVLSSESINAVVICPNNATVRENLIFRLKENFENKLNVIKTVNAMYDVDKDPVDYDVLINTTSLSFGIAEYVSVSPLLKDIEIKKMQQEMSILKKTKRKSHLREMLLNMFGEGSFSKASYHDAVPEQDYYNLLVPAGLTKEDFIIATFFRRVTVSIASDYDAPKSSMSVVISESPVPWFGTDKTSIAVFVSLSKSDRQAFYSQFSMFLDLFDDNILYPQLMMSSSFEDFANILNRL